ncbi:hypothetical protein FDUTEX481_05607 [Tolypothrix sp. PCC 7601]|nr:hypothetical protein FDUTEX481_05607 [Tolypothrix sp. PCC 7601]
MHLANFQVINITFKGKKSPQIQSEGWVCIDTAQTMGKSKIYKKSATAGKHWLENLYSNSI